MSQQQRSINAVFYDEEDCLGFGVFVAELELILGTSRDRRPDQVQLLELLQKLQASISTSEASLLKKHQKRCEAALYDIIYKGGCGVVCPCMILLSICNCNNCLHALSAHMCCLVLRHGAAL
jgi:hypothetical protein